MLLAAARFFIGSRRQAPEVSATSLDSVLNRMIADRIPRNEQAGV